MWYSGRWQWCRHWETPRCTTIVDTADPDFAWRSALILSAFITFSRFDLRQRSQCLSVSLLCSLLRCLYATLQSSVCDVLMVERQNCTSVPSSRSLHHTWWKTVSFVDSQSTMTIKVSSLCCCSCCCCCCSIRQDSIVYLLLRYLSKPLCLTSSERHPVVQFVRSSQYPSFTS